MRYEDEVEEGDEVVRSFMVTNGRVRARVEELAIETLVTPTAAGCARSSSLKFERRRIVEEIHEPMAIVEIAARLELPLRAVLVLVSEMVDDGLLSVSSVVHVADRNLLVQIRQAIDAL